MDLVLIAGGLGTRLRPLTLRRPKALVPLLNRPLILHVLERVPRLVDRVIVPVNYLYEPVRDFLGTVDLGREIVVVHEKEPLGTGGAIRNVADRLSGTFFVGNADVVDSLDYEALLRFHRKRGGIGTVAVWPAEDPTAFGVVALEGDRITRFVEKPSEGEAPSHLINAGRYVFERELLDAIEAGRMVSLEREVFPKILPKGLYAFRWDGYWADVGTLSSYLEAQRILLEARGVSRDGEADLSRADVQEFVLAGAGTFAEGRLGPYVVLGQGCRIGRASIRNAALFDHVSVDDKAEIDSSIVGEGASIGEGAFVHESILGDGVQVPPHARLLGARVGL